MKTIVYNKLIRDRIPEIIESDGKECEVTVLSDDEYLKQLNIKLKEELDEYYESGEAEELADIAEIIYAIANLKGLSNAQFEKLRLNKREQRGGFEKKLYLKCVRENEH